MIGPTNSNLGQQYLHMFDFFYFYFFLITTILMNENIINVIMD